MVTLREKLKPEFYKLNRRTAEKVLVAVGLEVEDFSEAADRERKNHYIQLWQNCCIYGSGSWLFD